jgi:SAM-dependent methyltransferase
VAVGRNDNGSLKDLLVCPVCKGGLDYSPGLIRCIACHSSFPQLDEKCFDLMPYDLLKSTATRWGERQKEMEEWYRDLISNPLEASACLAHDYEPYASLLATLSGTVLDVGGGSGLVRHYLAKHTGYIVVDPSLDWRGSGWTKIAHRFPCLETRPTFVRSIGEYLPFEAKSFDAVLALWSLNHVDNPATVFREMRRVLKPCGRFLAVLEDMEPTWSDLFGGGLRFRFKSQTSRIINLKLRCMMRGRAWPVQNDHIPINESDIREWSAGYFSITRRAWIGQYLTYEFHTVESA